MNRHLHRPLLACAAAVLVTLVVAALPADDTYSHTNHANLGG